MSEDSKVRDILEAFKDATDRESDMRSQMLDDAKFLALDQWPDSVRRERELDGQPCLTIDKANQYLNQVVNDIRQARPSIKVRPVDDNGDPETAEVYNGVIRNIQDVSRASIAYDWAVQCSTAIGRGWFRIVTDYDDDNTFDQSPYIRRVANPFSVYPGPYVEPDGSDMEWCIVAEELARSRYMREFGVSEADIKELQETATGDGRAWVTDETVRIAERFYVQSKTAKLVALSTGEVMLEDELEALVEQLSAAMQAQALPPMALPTVVGDRDTQIRTIEWCKTDGVRILEERDWLGKWIPVIPVHGVEQWVDGKRRLSGLVRPMKDSLRMYNYFASAITERVALQPKTPFVGPSEAFAGHEGLWAAANRESRAYLPYNHVGEDGNPLPAPSRTAPAAIESGMSSILQRIEHDVQTTVGVFKASLGDQSNEKSGRAILARQKEGDTATFHYSDNLSRSISHAGRILVDLIPKVYDVRRVVRLLGEDGEADSAVVDPRQPQALTKQRDMMGEVETIYNLGVGRYDVTVSTGPAYNTLRMEAAEAMMGMVQANPALMQVMGDLLFRAFDWPMADEIAKRLKATIPPNILQEDDDEDAPIPPRVQAAMAQVAQQQQLIQQQTVALQQAAQQAQADKAEIDAARTELEAQGKVLAADYKRMVAELRVKTIDGTQQAEQAAMSVLDQFGARQEAMLGALVQRLQQVEQVATTEASAERSQQAQIVAAVAQELGAVRDTVATVGAQVAGSQPVAVRIVRDKAGRPVKGIRTNADGSTTEVTIQ